MDLVADADPTVAARQNDIERLRDDSHLTMPAPGEVGAWLRDAGCEITTTAQRTSDRPVEPWMEQSLTPEEDRDHVRATMYDELDGTTTTGMRPYLHRGQLWFQHLWEATVAYRR